MRKIQQCQILELIDTICEAQSRGLFADAQDGVLAVGNFIESIEGEGTDTVKLLEEYCKLLFNASNGEIGSKVLYEHLMKIENSILGELAPNKIELVFISYIASMSDSMLSVYHAAKADPNCNAIWLIIPYYERNSDGSLGKMNYEGEACYPGIECVDWQQYDIEANHPDVVVSFAPYDEGNYVTSVHPDFYFKRMHELTDLLVYLPYFVVMDDVPEHFCTVAACIYAHKIITQSAKARQTFLRVFQGAFGDKFGKPKDKFVALGSPKLDLVVNTRREDCELPDAWHELIGNKKVVFYNTGLTAILASDEQHLRKLRSALDVFRQRKDIVLWWRPHPLSENTYDSMRQGLADEYRAIVAEYKKQNWGIYDDSPDFHRAIVWSDAYYGDGSSAVPLYGATGKPILLQDVSVTDILKNAVAFENIYDDGKYLWFTAIDFNALFRMDKLTWNPEYMGSFPNEEPYVSRAVRQSVYYGGKLFFAPFNSDTFYSYDLNKQVFEILTPEPAIINDSCYALFFSVIAYKQFIFYMGYKFKGIVRYDTNSGIFSCYDGWVNKIDSLIGQQEKYYFLNVSIINNKLYCPCIFAKAIVIFDMENCEYEIIRLHSRCEGFRGIAYDGKSFWLASEFDNEYMVRWDGNGKDVVEYKNPKAEPGVIWDVATLNESAWYLPYNCNTSFRVTDNDIEAVDELCNLYLDKDIYDWSGYTVIGDTIYLHMFRKIGNYLVSFNTATKELRMKQIYLDTEQHTIIMTTLANAFTNALTNCKTWQDCVTGETPEFNLKAYLKYIVNDHEISKDKSQHEKQKDLFMQAFSNADGTAGQAIYDYIKSLMLE